MIPQCKGKGCTNPADPGLIGYCNGMCKSSKNFLARFHSLRMQYKKKQKDLNKIWEKMLALE